MRSYLNFQLIDLIWVATQICQTSPPLDERQGQGEKQTLAESCVGEKRDINASHSRDSQSAKRRTMTRNLSLQPQLEVVQRLTISLNPQQTSEDGGKAHGALRPAALIYLKQPDILTGLDVAPLNTGRVRNEAESQSMTCYGEKKVALRLTLW